MYSVIYFDTYDDVTAGASSGIGEGVALKLASLGCRLVLTGRTQEKLDEVVGKCLAAGCAPGDVIHSTNPDLSNSCFLYIIVHKQFAI